MANYNNKNNNNSNNNTIAIMRKYSRNGYQELHPVKGHYKYVFRDRHIAEMVLEICSGSAGFTCRYVYYDREYDGWCLSTYPHAYVGPEEYHGRR